jgi:hypothetical protein
MSETVYSVAIAMGRINRWCGRGHFALSIAQHQTVLSYYVPPRLARAALIHDLSEFIVGEVPSPVKRKCYDLNRIEDRVQRVIFEKFDVPHENLLALHNYDVAIRVDEAKALGLTPPAGEGLGAVIDEMTALEASNAWLERYMVLFDEPGDPAEQTMEELRKAA